jgi:hypothetical protein
VGEGNKIRVYGFNVLEEIEISKKEKVEMGIIKRGQRKEMKKTEKVLGLFTISLFILMSGIMCNFLAIQGTGKMPVFATLSFAPSDSPHHFEFHDFDEVEYPYFTDILLIGYRDWAYSFSVGDVFLTIGSLFCGIFGVKYIYLYTIGKKRRFKGIKENEKSK